MNESKNLINLAWSLLDCFSKGTSISFIGRIQWLGCSFQQKWFSELSNLPKSFSFARNALSCNFCCVYLTKLTMSKKGYENGANTATITLDNIWHFVSESWYDLNRLYQNSFSLISCVKIVIITTKDSPTSSQGQIHWPSCFLTM